MKRRKRRPRGRFIAFSATVVVIGLAVALTASLSAKNVKAPTPERTGSITVKTDVPTESARASSAGEEPEPPAEQELESLGEFELTAYCPCVKCCGEWSAEHPSRIGTDYVQKTASGTVPLAGRTIGVDPDVIPFGTTIVINGREYIAEDRGGAINGNRIDIFFTGHDEALEFGRQTAEVFIKNKED